MNVDIAKFKSSVTLHINGSDVSFNLDEICHINQANIENDLMTLPKYFTFFSSLLIDAEHRKKTFMKELSSYEATAKKILREKLSSSQQNRVTDEQVRDAVDRHGSVITKRHILINLEYEVEKCKHIIRSLEMKEKSIKQVLYLRQQEMSQLHYQRAMASMNADGTSIDINKFNAYKKSVENKLNGAS